ncbi:MAG: DUF4423 domain-containing protein [Bdellovibrionaceae bacterium]|nr:DUF4423 domain-containing protein [Pseudobdellovibrionaceae bacterium]
MTIFDYSDYKTFLNEKLLHFPNKGHGQLSKIARALNIHTSLVSQIIHGEKHFTFEQACDLCSFFGFTELESDYLVALVLKERAGTPKAQLKCNRDLDLIKKRAQTLTGRLKKDAILSDADSALFFSHWHYAAVKIAVSLPNYNKPELLAENLKIPLSQVNKILEFLVRTQLLFYEKEEYKQGPSRLHIGAESPFVSRHHLNWRMKSVEKMGNFREDDFCFTMPTNLSIKDAKKIRQLLVDTVDQCVTTVDNSKPEQMYCLNIDWFKITDKDI